MFFSERLRAQSVIFTFTFVLLINFNNCGEGFQAVDGGNDQGAGSEIKKTPTGKISQDIEFLNISKNRISFASNFTFGKKNPPVKLEDDLYAITAYNFTDNIMKESLIYGSFNDLISNNYSELTKPDLSEYLNEFDIINEKYYFSNHGNRYDDSLVKHIYYNAQLSLKSDSATELNLHFVYTKNNSLSFFPLLFFKSDDRENNTINTKTKISKSWFYYTTNNQELYIHNNQTDERINVQSTPIISPDEVWLINPKQDGLCHAINIQTKSSFALGPPIDILKPNCKSYSFLTSNIIVENFYNNGLFYESENYERNDNNILRDIKIINLDNKRTTTLSNKYFSFDFQKQVITYLDDSNFINKQLLDDFLEGKKPLISFRRLNFSSMTKNYDTDIWLKSFNSFFAILSKKSNQAPLLINNLTQHVHNLSDHISLMNKSKYFGQSWSPDGNPLTIHKFGSDYYATVNKSDFFKINFSTEKPNEIDLPIYNCATSETPKTKLSETCIWNLVTLGKPYKNFFKFNVRFPLKTESLNVKERWIYLPPGTSIDNSDENNWVFPQGTIFFKNFAYTNSSGTNHVLKNLETRVIEKISNNEGPGAWRPSVYVWNNQQTEATYTEGGLDIELNHNGNIYT